MHFTMFMYILYKYSYSLGDAIVLICLKKRRKNNVRASMVT
jgi:hypothetical protein